MPLVLMLPHGTYTPNGGVLIYVKHQKRLAEDKWWQERKLL